MAVEVQEQKQKPKSLRVRVVDTSDEKRPVVNVRMPAGVVKFGLKMAKAFAPEMKDVDLDWNEISALFEEGESGKIVEVEDEKEHRTVEVWLE
ncbi:MAG TPA: hypothetical protein VF160_07085 [Candidatus Dormibacteraeota bacterium]